MPETMGIRMIKKHPKTAQIFANYIYIYVYIYIYIYFFLFFFFLLCPRHVEVPGPGMEPKP